MGLALFFLVGCAPSYQNKPLAIQPLAVLPRSTSSHVVIIVMENEENTNVLGNHAAPYANALVRRYGLATQSFAVGHPSLPNYLSLTSGSTQELKTDCTTCSVQSRNIVDQLEAADISWNAYLEGVPTPCFRGVEADGYAKKHNPFVYYSDIAGSPGRCRHLVGFDRLTDDLNNGTLPTYSWISPNLCDDGHDCGVAGGDRFLALTVPALLRELGPRGFLVITWDEGKSEQGCCSTSVRGGHIVTILAGPDVVRGGRDGTPVDHYGVLGTIEQALGLTALANAADLRNGRLSALFLSPPHIK